MKNLSLLVFAILSFTVANAFIFQMSAPTAPFTVKANTKMSVVFFTTNSLDTAEDFALTCGLGSASDQISGNALGDIILQTFNLVSLGHAITGDGNFTLAVSMSTSNAGELGSGNFTLSCGTQSAFGALFFAQVNVFRQNITLIN